MNRDGWREYVCAKCGRMFVGIPIPPCVLAVCPVCMEEGSR